MPLIVIIFGPLIARIYLHSTVRSLQHDSLSLHPLVSVLHQHHGIPYSHISQNKTQVSEPLKEVTLIEFTAFIEKD
jgi:hypothetical protein